MHASHTQTPCSGDLRRRTWLSRHSRDCPCGFLEAEAVKDFWGGVKGRNHGYGLCGDANGGIGGDREAIMCEAR